ncbi:MAG: GlsB/YeaQ/YmgE family stress response membrane protein [Acidothermaceae bacterium]
MHITGIGSALLAGVVIGLLGRWVAPRRRPLGCLLTLAIGIVGSSIGTAIGVAIHSGFWIIFLCQILIAALLVTLFSVGAPKR